MKWFTMQSIMYEESQAVTPGILGFRWSSWPIGHAKVNKQRIPLIVLWVVVANLGALARADAGEVQDKLEHHPYQVGESWEYFFENTETTYVTTEEDKVPRPQQAVRFDELQLRVRIDVEKAQRRLTLLDGKFRTFNSNDLKSPESMPEFQSVWELIPSLPKTFSYAYESDGQAVQTIAKDFAPFMSDRMGQQLYFKMLDIHTFQATIDGLPSETVGTVAIGKSRDIQLAQGLFHNHKPVRLFQRIDQRDGQPFAYYKIMTAGNYYNFDKQPLDTTYQYTFRVPLSGSTQGIVDSGELQELVFVHHDDRDPVLIQRQLSLELQTPKRTSGKVVPPSKKFPAN